MDSKQFPCPICKNLTSIIGINKKGKKIGSCGCAFKFKISRSQKDFNRKYIQTKDGFERV